LGANCPRCKGKLSRGPANQKANYSAKLIRLLATLPPGLFAPWLIHPCTLDDSPFDSFASWLVRL